MNLSKATTKNYVISFLIPISTTLVGGILGFYTAIYKTKYTNNMTKQLKNSKAVIVGVTWDLMENTIKVGGKSLVRIPLGMMLGLIGGSYLKHSYDKHYVW